MTDTSPILQGMTTRDERLLFITDPDIPRLKHLIKQQADREDTSSAELMVRSLCEAFDIESPTPERRAAKEVQDTETLSLAVPVELWQAIHIESGVKLTSKKEVVLTVFYARFDKKPKKPKRPKAKNA